MSFDIDNVPAPEGKSYSKTRMPVGQHVVIIENIRQQMTQKTGLSFFVDIAGTGELEAQPWASFSVCPDVAVGGGGLSPMDAKKRDKQKIKAIVAAILGVEFNAVTSKIYEAVVATERNAVSCLSGRKAVLVVIPSTGKKAPGSPWYKEILPYGGQQPALPIHVQALLAAPPAVSAPAPVVPAVKPLPEGWQVHPTNPLYAFKGQEVRALDTF